MVSSQETALAATLQTHGLYAVPIMREEILGRGKGRRPPIPRDAGAEAELSGGIAPAFPLSPSLLLPFSSSFRFPSRQGLGVESVVKAKKGRVGVAVVGRVQLGASRRGGATLVRVGGGSAT